MASQRKGLFKLKNSPGRKDARRRSALVRREREGAPQSELDATRAKLDAGARGVRTKKDRSANAKFYRRAS